MDILLSYSAFNDPPFNLKPKIMGKIDQMDVIDIEVPPYDEADLTDESDLEQSGDSPIETPGI